MKYQELFSKIKDENFELFITNDQNLKFQINKNKLNFSFLDLNFPSNRYEDLLSIMPLINEELIKLMKFFNTKELTIAFTFLKILVFNFGQLN